MSKFTIAIDVDGTLVEHKFPEMGDPVPGAIEWCKKFQEAGAKLILWTMRSKGQTGSPKSEVDDGDYLKPVVDWLEAEGIKLYGVNKNPSQRSWTKSPKVYANCYIDDNAIGCPLIYPPNGDRPYVDWAVVGPMVMNLIEGKS